MPKQDGTGAGVALLVHSCDRYELLYRGFGFFFNRYWDPAIACTNYFATEEKHATLPSFTNLRSGRGEWADRLVRLLNQIEEDYVLYLQEDMWLTEPVSAAMLNPLFAYAHTHQPNCIKLHSAEFYRTKPTEKEFGGLRLAALDNAQSAYLMSHQISLWKKSFLLEQLRPGEHPWRNERKATARMKKTNPELHQIDLFAENGKGPVNENNSVALRSGYYTVSVNGMLGEHAPRFFPELAADPAQAEYADQLKRHFEQQLTHDGRPKPRKEDPLQKFKRWLRGKG